MTLIPILRQAETAYRRHVADVEKALVMAAVAPAVAAGGAAIVTLESGAIELRVATGEVFLLGDEAVTRVA
jgi:hypothetical protein